MEIVDNNLLLVRTKYPDKIKEEEFATNERDILNDLKADFEIERKSNGQRLRNILYKLWENDKDGFLTFTKYYDHKMEQLINHFKSKLEL